MFTRQEIIPGILGSLDEVALKDLCILFVFFLTAELEGVGIRKFGFVDAADDLVKLVQTLHSYILWSYLSSIEHNTSVMDILHYTKHQLPPQTIELSRSSERVPFLFRII